MSVSETPPKEAAWQVLDRVTAARKSLLAAGYDLTPTNGKLPFLNSWQKTEATEAEVDRWAREYPDALNTGIVTATTPAVDIDVLDHAVAEELQSLLWTMIGDNGQALVRYGRRPKRAVLFQTSEPFDKLSTPFFVSPNGDAHRVEVLCDGQQFIAHGTHPDTGTAYMWEGGEPASVPRDNLPHLSASVAANFVAKATELMRARGWIIQKKKKNGDTRKPNGSATGGAADFDSICGGREQKWAAAALTDLAAELAGMAPESGRNERLYRAAFRMGTMVARGWIDRAAVEDRLLGACRANELERDTGADAVRASLKSGLDGGEAVPHPDLDEQQAGNEAWRNNKPQAPLPPLQWIDMSAWDNEPAPLREWAILNRSPLNQAGLFSGHGGTGKSIVELTKDVAHVAGKDWFGSMPALGPAIYIGAEDDADEIHRRLADIAAHYGVTFKELIEGGLHVLCLLGQDATLCVAGSKSGKVEVTDLYRQIYEAAGDIKPKNISIDTLSRAFAGNEIDRVQVYGFAMHMQALAMVASGSVTVLSHPSLQGMSSGSGISGSTAWHNAFRFRHYLKGVKPGDDEQPDNDLRELEFLKNQYGSLGEKVILRYRNGLFLPEPGISNLDKAVREARVEEIFIAGLGQIVRQGRAAIYGENSPEYGPTLIAQLPEVKKERVGKKDLVRAMNQLLAASKIHIGETDGTPSKRKKCLLVGPRPTPIPL